MPAVVLSTDTCSSLGSLWRVFCSDGQLWSEHVPLAYSKRPVLSNPLLSLLIAVFGCLQQLAALLLTRQLFGFLVECGDPLVRSYLFQYLMAGKVAKLKKQNTHLLLLTAAERESVMTPYTVRLRLVLHSHWTAGQTSYSCTI